MKTYNVYVDSGYRFEYHSTIVAESVKEARQKFMTQFTGCPELWNGAKSFRVSKINA